MALISCGLDDYSVTVQPYGFSSKIISCFKRRNRARHTQNDLIERRHGSTPITITEGCLLKPASCGKLTPYYIFYYTSCHPRGRDRPSEAIQRQDQPISSSRRAGNYVPGRAARVSSLHIPRIRVHGRLRRSVALRRRAQGGVRGANFGGWGRPLAHQKGARGKEKNLIPLCHS